MIVRCPKCKSEYNAGPEYHGQSFQCQCGEIVFVEAPAEKKAPAPKPVSPAASPKAEQAAKKTEAAKPAAKTEAKKETSEKKAAPASETSPKKEEKKESAETSAGALVLKAPKTIYAFFIKIVCVLGILTELANFLFCYEFAGGMAASLPIELEALPIIIFLAIWCVSSVFIFLFFAVLGALFRLADIACRAAGVRPIPL